MTAKKRKKIKNPYQYKPTGRPSVFTDAVVEKLEQAFAIGCTVVEACIYANIDKATFYNNSPPGTALFDRFMELKERPVLKARSTVVNSLDDPEHAKWYLQKKRREEFHDKTVSSVEVTEISDEQAKKVLEEIAKKENE